MKKESIDYPLQYTKGIGPNRSKALASEGILTPSDLIHYFPHSYIDRSTVQSISELYTQLQKQTIFTDFSKVTEISFYTEITILATVCEKKEHQLKGGRKMLAVYLEDGTGMRAKIVFWNRTEYFNKYLSVDDFITVSGRPELDRNTVLFNHPEIEKIDQEDQDLYRGGIILPKYRITESMKNTGISMRLLRQVILSQLSSIDQQPEESFPDFLNKKYNFPDSKKTIETLHFPETAADLAKAREKVKYEEIFYFQIFLALRHKKVQIQEQGIRINPKSALARRLYDNLPYQLTNDQKKVLREIAQDFESGSPMNRLLQGDVGSGKTIVALLAMLMAIDFGLQIAFMAPTELLAEQHFRTLNNFLKDFNIKITLLVGGQKTKLRRNILEDISSGKSQIIIGTHALFQAHIEYNKLGFIIIDEQHRFGVAQRSELVSLAKKSQSESQSPHILVMSATPIPRTLSMTVYGDLDVSVIREMPKNRKSIITKISFNSKLPEIYQFIRTQIKKGNQAYIVYPLVEKSEKLELKAATEFFEILDTEIFPDLRCGLLHGQMLWYEKDDAMNAFLSKEYDILVATTVIEVGIDVPNATIMLIENSERFGLSQLHQLRGRVGRGSDQSYCILVTKDHFQFLLKDKSKELMERKAAIIRLKTMEDTSDGFEIAEIDLKLRGPGDLLGTRQAGLPSFKYIDLVSDIDIVSRARNDAFDIIGSDNQLRKPENAIIRDEYLKRYKPSENYFNIA
ncbi:MAG: ATP-dependent DNA helicase RecG [Candidatus Kapabacteria bacterium]|nr:ATP-dependent DNA helicase RecG [Candidatus Kapabacteria bacterium]